MYSKGTNKRKKEIHFFADLTRCALYLFFNGLTIDFGGS